MPVIEISRSYRASLEATYKALVTAVSATVSTWAADDLARAVSFETSTSILASAANVTAYVEANTPQFSTVHVEGQAKARSYISGSAEAHQQLAAILDEITRALQATRAAPHSGGEPS